MGILTMVMDAQLHAHMKQVGLAQVLFQMFALQFAEMEK